MLFQSLLSVVMSCLVCQERGRRRSIEMRLASSELRRVDLEEALNSLNPDLFGLGEEKISFSLLSLIDLGR